MCGILGFINAEKFAFNKGKTLFNQMMLDGVKRGDDGTGAMVLRDKTLHIHKSVMWSPDFVASPTYGRMILPHLDDARFAVGHNRAATKGSISHENSHPFQHEHITLVHNGYIQNAWGLLPTGVRHDVDSFSAAYTIAEKGEKEALESLRGAFALVWYNAVDNTLNMARNDTRELWLMYLADEKGKELKTLLFMSEWPMLYALMHRNGLYPGGKFRLLTPFQHIKFNLDNPREYTRTPFVEPPTQVVYHGGHTGSTTRPYTTQGAAAGNTGTNWTEGTGGGPAEGRTKSGGHAPSDKELERLHGQFKALSKTDRTRVGIPSSRKKLRNLYVKLSEHGFRLGQSILIYADNFACYKNQKERGVILGSKRADVSVLVEIPNVLRGTFEKTKTQPGVYATVVNYRIGQTGKLVLICMLEERKPPQGPVIVRAKEKEALKTPTECCNTIQECCDAQVCLLTGKIEDIKKTVISHIVKGPGGSMIEREKFEQLTKDGCGWCTKPIDQEKAGDVLWLTGTPVCHVCASDTEIMRELGIAHPAFLH